MERREDYLLSNNLLGVLSVMNAATVTVYIGGTLVLDLSGNVIAGTKATLYSDNGVTPLPNPITSDSIGNYFYYASDGTYDEYVTKTGYSSLPRYGVRLLADAEQTIRSHILDRKYNVVTTVTSGSSIATAVNAITDATAFKRYLVYVKNGTYNERFTMKSYVDVVGESRDGVIIETHDETDTHLFDTIDFNAANAMLAHLSVYRTNTNGASSAWLHYPIHADAVGDQSASSEQIVWNCYLESNGPFAYPALGAGVAGNQKLYIVDCEAISGYWTIFIHNSAIVNHRPNSVSLINTRATGGIYGFAWRNIGSGSPDQVFISGGYYRGSLADMDFRDIESGGGAGEAVYSIQDNVDAPNISIVTGTRIDAMPRWYPKPESHDVGNGHYTPIWTNGVIGDGTLKGFYKRVGNSVTVFINMTAGASTTFGGGAAWSFSVPVVNNNYVSAIGTAFFYDSNAAITYTGIARLAKNDTQINLVYDATAPWLGWATPFVWAVGDLLEITITYEID